MSCYTLRIKRYCVINVVEVGSGKDHPLGSKQIVSREAGSQ